MPLESTIYIFSPLFLYGKTGKKKKKKGSLVPGKVSALETG